MTCSNYTADSVATIKHFIGAANWLHQDQLTACLTHIPTLKEMTAERSFPLHWHKPVVNWAVATSHSGCRGWWLPPQPTASLLASLLRQTLTRGSRRPYHGRAPSHRRHADSSWQFWLLWHQDRHVGQCRSWSVHAVSVKQQLQMSQFCQLTFTVNFGLMLSFLGNLQLD